MKDEILNYINVYIKIFMNFDLPHSSEHFSTKPQCLNTIKNNNRCRICLQEDEQVISLPCGCRDEIGKIHIKCFMKWVQTKTPPKVIPKMTEIKCQICLKMMKIEIQTKKRARNCTQINQKHSNCQILSSFASIIIILCLIYLCIRGIIDSAGNGSIFILYVIYAAAIIFMLIVLKVVIQLTLRIFIKTQIEDLKFIGHGLQNTPQGHQKQ